MKRRQRILQAGDKVLHTLMREGYRMFEIEAFEPSGRCVLKGLDKLRIYVGI